MLTSAGILVLRNRTKFECLLVHCGGPFWQGKDEHAWSFPKGQLEEGEDPWSAAQREWREETNLMLPPCEAIVLPTLKSKRKRVHPFLIFGDIDLAPFRSNIAQVEWPEGSGVIHEFPEADKIGWFGFEEAKYKMHKYLQPVLQYALEYIV